MVSDFTLSRQRENIAGLEVEWRRVLVNRARTSCPPAGAARSFHMEGSFCVVVRSARTGGQDVRAPPVPLRAAGDRRIQFPDHATIPIHHPHRPSNREARRGRLASKENL